MSPVDNSPSAVAERVRRALELGRSGEVTERLAKGVRMTGDAVRDRLRQVGELRRVGLLLRHGNSRSSNRVADKQSGA